MRACRKIRDHLHILQTNTHQSPKPVVYSYVVTNIMFLPLFRALATMSAADLLITCTTYSGQSAPLASMIARLVASAST